jgi:thioesterase domain-containing protein
LRRLRRAAGRGTCEALNPPALTPAQLGAALHEKIPLARAMGVRILSCGDGRISLEAPLDLNHNHLGTAFGGSLNAVATLAGYALIWWELNDPDCHVVIRESSISFRRPVRKNLRAFCRLPEPAALAAFKKDFARKYKARIELPVTIEEDGAVAVRFHGTFVAIKDAPPPHLPPKR